MESTPTEESEGKAIVQVLAVVLERLVSANCQLAAQQKSEELTKFHALRVPAISLVKYLERIHKYASCSKECFILALIYIDRLIQGNHFILTELNVHRVLITAILLAAKFFDDAYYNNAYYAKVGGVLTSEMNSLEVDFLFRINFSLRVEPHVFEKYHAELKSHSSEMGLTSIKSCTDEDLQAHGEVIEPPPADYSTPPVISAAQDAAPSPQLDFSEMLANASSLFASTAARQQLQRMEEQDQVLHSSQQPQMAPNPGFPQPLQHGMCQPHVGDIIDLAFPTLPDLINSQYLQRKQIASESINNPDKLAPWQDPAHRLLQASLTTQPRQGTFPTLATQHALSSVPFKDATVPVQAPTINAPDFSPSRVKYTGHEGEQVHQQFKQQHQAYQQQHAEITPSPPLQAPIIDGAPAPCFPKNVKNLTDYLNMSSIQGLQGRNICGGPSSSQTPYTNPVDAHMQQSFFPSQPIAIGDAAAPVDTSQNWAYVSSFERRASGFP